MDECTFRSAKGALEHVRGAVTRQHFRRKEQVVANTSQFPLHGSGGSPTPGKLIPVQCGSRQGQRNIGFEQVPLKF
jgi:hypothetical protein